MFSECFGLFSGIMASRKKANRTVSAPDNFHFERASSRIDWVSTIVPPARAAHALGLMGRFELTFARVTLREDESGRVLAVLQKWNPTTFTDTPTATLSVMLTMIAPPKTPSRPPSRNYIIRTGSRALTWPRFRGGAMLQC